MQVWFFSSNKTHLTATDAPQMGIGVTKLVNVSASLNPALVRRTGNGMGTQLVPASVLQYFGLGEQVPMFASCK